MDRGFRLRTPFAVAAIALVAAGVATAQSKNDGSTTTTGSSVTSTTAIATLDPMAPIGSTSIVRADSSNQAFEKLAHGRAFLSRADVDALPSFGDAFAKADRDGDGRLDRTEFVDAWSYYVGPIAPPGATDMPAVPSGETTAGTPAQADTAPAQ